MFHISHTFLRDVSQEQTGAIETEAVQSRGGIRAEQETSMKPANVVDTNSVDGDKKPEVPTLELPAHDVMSRNQ